MIDLTELDFAKIANAARAIARARGVRQAADIDDMVQNAMVAAMELAAQDKRLNVAWCVNDSIRAAQKNKELQVSDFFFGNMEG